MGAGLIAFVLCPGHMREATRALVGWNVGALTFMALVFRMMLNSKDEDIKGHASQEDENTPMALLLIAVVAATCAIAAIVSSWGRSRICRA